MAKRNMTNSNSRRGGTTTQTISRGGVQKRSSPRPKIDKDGDLDMDASADSSRGRGGHRGSTGPGRRGRPTRSMAPEAMQKIIKGINSGEAVIRGRGENRFRAGVPPKEPRADRKQSTPAWDQISVRGWTESKAASNPGGGVKELIEFLQRKASIPAAPVRIKKSRTEGDTLIVSVQPEDTPSILRLNNFSFAGAPLTIQKREVEPPKEASKDTEVSDTTAQLKEKFTAMLGRRYNPETKILDLTTLGTDPEFASTGIFEEHSSQSKFFPALMKICDSVFTSRKQKAEMVLGITLANNNLPNVASVTTLAPTFPDLKNLDLSNNNIRSLKSLEAWRRKFRSLEILLLTGNPIETEEPTYGEEVVKWFPTLRYLNGVEIRRIPEGYAAAAIGKSEEQLQTETVTLQFAQETGMTLHFSTMCLEAAGGNLDVARQAFEASKASLTPEMFLVQ